MAADSKLEGAIYIPSGGWSASVTDGTGTAAVTVPGTGYCFLSSAGELTDSLLEELEDQLNATMTDTFAVFLDSSTGRVTIANTSANNTAITWTDTDLRDALGFTGNISGAAAHTGPQQARGLWLPSSPYQTESNAGADAGWPVTDYMASKAPDGSVFALFANEYKENALSFTVARERCWAASEVLGNESFERLLRDCIWGTAAFGTPGGPVNWHPDKDNDAAFYSYRVVGMREFKPSRPVATLAGVWTVEVSGLIEVPT